MTVVRETVAALLRDTVGQGTPAPQKCSFSKHSGRGVGVAAALALSLGFGVSAHAHQAPASGDSAASSEALSLDEVTVTGSRIRRSTDFDTANPTTVVDSDYLKNLGVANVSQALEMLPSNVSTFSATNTGTSSQRVLDGCCLSGIAEFCALITPDVPR